MSSNDRKIRVMLTEGCIIRYLASSKYLEV